MQPIRAAAAPAGAVLAVLLLAATGPGPRTAWAALQDAGGAPDPLGPVLALVALAAWTVTAWLLVVVTCTAGGHLAGALGRLLAGLARRLAPAAVRRTVELVLGLTVVAGALAGPAAASAADAGPTAPLSLDWAPAPVAPATVDAAAGTAAPVQAGSATAPDLDWPAAPAPAATDGGGSDSDTPTDSDPRTDATVTPGVAGTASAVVVRPGDTLWGLAEAELQARTGAAPSDREVAQAWPAWWAANREAVGPDPHLLLPGTALQPPASR